MTDEITFFDPDRPVENGTVHVLPAVDGGCEEGAEDLINYPRHYRNHPSGEECITFAEWLGFNAGNAFKYVWRASEKGAHDQDLRKAVWYLDRALANPATVPHRRFSDLPLTVHTSWTRVMAVCGADSPLAPLWETQFTNTPRPYLENARRLVSAALEGVL